MTVIRSPIRPVIFSPIRQPTTLYKGGGLPWYPNRLFQSGDILLWYDPSDLSTMFKDTAGTQPVTADGDSVALMLDKGQWGGKTLSQVLAAQPELVANGTFDSDVSGWSGINSATIAWSAGRTLVSIANVSSSGLSSDVNVSVIAGKVYEITAEVEKSTFSGSSVALVLAGVSSNSIPIAASGVTVVKARITSPVTVSTSVRVLRGGPGTSGDLYVDNVSVKEIPGYHRIQATGTSMPKYKTGPNPAAAENSPELVTNGTFDTDTTGWTVSTGGGGTPPVLSVVSGRLRVTADAVSPGTYPRALYTVNGLTIGRSYRVTGSIWANSNSSKIDIAGFNLSPWGTTDRAVSLVFTATGTSAQIEIPFNGTPAGGAILEADNISFKEIPASAPYIHWLLYDGTDDSHATSGINWGTDEVAACVGLYKSSDAAQACFAAFGTNGGTPGVSAERGLILAPGAAAATTYYARFGGSLTPIQAVATGYAAPHTGVVSARGKIATDLQGISVNRGTEALGSGDMGTGNFGSAMPMHFGRRASTSLPFNGREYQTVIRSRLLSAAELASLETFVAEKTGVILP